MIYNYDIKDMLRWEEVSVRLYGQPKLKKPSDLKGIKESFKVPLHSRCSMSCHVKDNDVYIKCRDYFSVDYTPEGLEGTPLSVRCEAMGIKPKKSKFIYQDNWGSIVLRNEAWLKISGIVKAISIAPVWEVATSLENVANRFYEVNYGWNEGLNCDWIRFIDDLVPALSRYLCDE